MNIVEHIISAIRCLSASKMRTFLTTLGIIVGISSVILINTIGGTIAKSIESTLSGMIKGNMMVLAVITNNEDGMSLDMEYTFPENVIQGYNELVEGKADHMVDSQIMTGYIEGENGNKALIQLDAITSVALTTGGYTLEAGRELTKDDDKKGTSSIMLDKKAADKIFGKEDPIGKTVHMENSSLTFTVAGVYSSPVDSSAFMLESGAEETTYAYIPSSFIKKHSDSSFDEFMVTYLVNNDVDIDELKKITNEYFSEFIDESEGNSLYIEFLSDDLKMIDSVIDVITTVIAAIAAVSLLVGGIGVMNIMLVSVTERTMEIGVRKAMGADNKSIRIQFITESIIISLLGSVLGIVAGLVNAKLLAIVVVKMAESSGIPVSVDLAVPISAVVLSVVFSFVVGLVFGVYPADKAAKMQVVDALRYE